MRFKPLVRKDKIVVGAEELAALFYEQFAKLRPPMRLASMQERLLERIAALEKKRAVALYRKWVNEPQYLGTEEELKRLSLRRAKKAYAPVREQVKSFAFVDIVGTYGDLFARWLEEGGELPASRETWRRIAADTTARLAEAERLPYEDAVPMLYLLEALHGASRMNRIRHVIVDEAQDYTPLQWAYLRRLFPNAGFTAVGDARQAIHAGASRSGEAHMESSKLFPAEETLTVRLRKSYRSTRQIVAFAGALLPDADEIEPFERDGAPPDVHALSLGEAEFARRVAARIAELRAEGFASIAVVAKTLERAEAACRTLGEAGERAALLTKETVSFPSGLVVLPSYLSKGLEFDAVVVWDAEAASYGREEERNLFYTVCTRALHRLSVFANGTLSPFVERVPDALYEARK